MQNDSSSACNDALLESCGISTRPPITTAEHETSSVLNPDLLGMNGPDRYRRAISKRPKEAQRGHATLTHNQTAQASATPSAHEQAPSTLKAVLEGILDASSSKKSLFPQEPLAHQSNRSGNEEPFPANVRPSDGAAALGADRIGNDKASHANLQRCNDASAFGATLDSLQVAQANDVSAVGATLDVLQAAQATRRSNCNMDVQAMIRESFVAHLIMA